MASSTWISDYLGPITAGIGLLWFGNLTLILVSNRHNKRQLFRTSVMSFVPLTIIFIVVLVFSIIASAPNSANSIQLKPPTVDF